MSTTKLYWEDPFALTFDVDADAERTRRASYDGKPSIVLSRTLFYPEAGGQLGDTGSLEIGGETFAVADTQIDDDGTIHHIVPDLDAAAELAGPVRGAVDRDRRRDHMAQHTAQHMLSRALADVARAETVSARLGATACTLDVDKPGIQERDLARAEDLVNAVVTDDVVVSALFPREDELAKLPLRRAPKVATNIRVIQIGDFDYSPCGGTHCTRTGQIGVVRVAGVEKYKGGLRVTFHAARRAIEDARRKEKVLDALAKRFTCGALDIGAAVAKLEADLEARRDALSAARGELVELVAREVLRAHPVDESGTTRIVLSRAKDDLATLRALAGRLTAREDVVAVCTAPDGETGDLSVVIQRGAKTSFDCGAWLKSTAAAHGGRGGGRPERAEGRLPRGVAPATLLG